MTDTNPTGIKVSAGTARGIDYQSAWTLNRLIDPDIEPVTVAEAKMHMHEQLVDADNDTYIGALITAAREWVEDYTGRALIDQTWQLIFEGYSYCEIKLHRSPVIEVESFIYDLNGEATTVDTAVYQLDGARTKWPRVIQAYGQSFPASYWFPPLTIQFRAGYADRSASPTEGAEKVPEVFKHAIKLLVGHLYENREAMPNQESVPMAVKWLLNSQRCELGVV